jgi:hypothetical protein
MLSTRLACSCCRAPSRVVAAATPTMVTPAEQHSKDVRPRRPRKHRIDPVWLLKNAATSADHDRHAVKGLGVLHQPMREGALRHGIGEVLVRDLADLRP